MLTLEPFLTRSDPKEMLILVCDASNVSIGAMLSYKNKLGGINVIVHGSIGLIIAEKNKLD